MNKTNVLAGLLALGFALCLVAQSEADYSGWMKDVAATKGKVTKGIAAKQNADVATDAAHLADLFKQVGAFWSNRSVSDAVTIAKNAETAANDLAAAAKAGDEAKMQSSMQAVNGNCSACHTAHREGAPGNFKIK
jgi:mono/diheme cytochrome c family protein